MISKTRPLRYCCVRRVHLLICRWACIISCRQRRLLLEPTYAHSRRNVVVSCCHQRQSRGTSGGKDWIAVVSREFRSQNACGLSSYIWLILDYLLTPVTTLSRNGLLAGTEGSGGPSCGHSCLLWLLVEFNAAIYPPSFSQLPKYRMFF